MTRQFATEIAIVPGDGRGQWLRARLDMTDVAPEDYSTHARDTARTVPHSTLAGAVELFAAIGGQQGNWNAYADGNWVVQPLPAAAVAEPWRLAILANLADFATHPSDDDIRLFNRIEIAAPALAGVSIDHSLADLALRMAAARQALTARLPSNFYLDEYSGAAWPEETDAYAFDIEMTLARPLDSGATMSVSAHLDALETMVAWMGFATEGTALEWVNQGAMVFAGETRASATTLFMRAERPPSDIALALEFASEVAHRAGSDIIGWTIDIRQAD